MEGHARLRRTASIALVATVALSAAAFGANPSFPGTDPNESVRLNTPNDPDFDRCESDNQGGATCSNVFDQEIDRFGFAPS